MYRKEREESPRNEGMQTNYDNSLVPAEILSQPYTDLLNSQTKWAEQCLVDEGPRRTHRVLIIIIEKPQSPLLTVALSNINILIISP